MTALSARGGVNGSQELEICRRCQSIQICVAIRSEPLCRDCLVKYVQSKVVKRMENFRVRYSTAETSRKLLLPLSLGVSSTTLLHVLDDHLQHQRRRTGRSGFALHILFVEGCPGQTHIPAGEIFETVKERYPDYTYQMARLGDVMANGEAFRDISSNFATSSDVDVTNGDLLESFLCSLPSATSRADVQSILRTRLVVRCAKANDCEGVLWGDTTTRLAEKTLAETAKGRGSSLPWQISDGTRQDGLAFFFPLRDLLKKELFAFANLVEPPLTSFIAISSSPNPEPVSAKDRTIDGLMQRYFETVEADYPSIVANVVRTTSKLQAPEVSEVSSLCRLCSAPLQKSSLDTLCYGCTRSIHGSRIVHK